MVGDTYLILLSISFILLCILFHTWSLIMTIATLLNVIFSLSISYFIYTFIFQIHFFPFLNVLTVIILIGISTDSSFIMTDVWRAIQINDLADSLIDVVAKTLRHSMLFISLSKTTVFCILATKSFSTIDGIRCFRYVSYQNTYFITKKISMFIQNSSC